MRDDIDISGYVNYTRDAYRSIVAYCQQNAVLAKFIDAQYATRDSRAQYVKALSHLITAQAHLDALETVR